MFLKWDDSLLTNIKWIDKQHKSFINKMDTFLNATISGKGKEEAVTALKEVEDYVKSHFATEEKYMIMHNYPNFNAHKIEHNKYREKFDMLKTTYSLEGASKDFLRQFQNEIINWWKNHINKFDKEMASFLKKKGDKL